MPVTKTKNFTKKIYSILENYFGPVSCPLNYSKDYELCIAVILSAQCTDERVNQVTPALFQKFNSLESFSKAKLSEIEKLIFSTGFYKNKSKSIKGFATKLIEDYNSKLPTKIEDLITLPGVGRKTANVILNEIFQISEGVVVDTHVKRLSKVWKLTDEEDPVKIEKDLMKKFDYSHWLNISLYMVFLGRKFCKAHKTFCTECPLNQTCPSSLVKYE
jgi:endonuclease III